MDRIYLLWLILAFVFAMAEAGTMGLTSIWFAVGSLCACAAALAHAPFWLQLVLFGAVSAVTVWLTRDMAKKRFNRNREHTNADRILGHRGEVLEAIDNRQAAGQVRVDGMVWTARSADGAVIPAGSDVVIRSIEGVKVIVTPLEQSAE